MISKAEKLNDLAAEDKQLLQAVLGLFAVPQMLEQIEQEVAGYGERLLRIEEAQCLHEDGIRELEGLHRKQSQALEAFYRKQSCMEEASRQQTLLSQQHYDRHVVEPLTRRVFPLIDMLSDASKNNDGQHLDILEAIQADLHELLAGYGVEPIFVSVGDIFDAKTMQPVHFVPTHRVTKDKTVEFMVRPGFRREERVLRVAMVGLYRFENPQSITLLTRKGENHE